MEVGAKGWQREQKFFLTTFHHRHRENITGRQRCIPSAAKRLCIADTGFL